MKHFLWETKLGYSFFLGVTSLVPNVFGAWYLGNPWLPATVAWLVCWLVAIALAKVLNVKPFRRHVTMMDANGSR